MTIFNSENDTLEFLRNKWTCLKLIVGFVGLTAIFVVIFLSIAMFIGH